MNYRFNSQEKPTDVVKGSPDKLPFSVVNNSGHPDTYTRQQTKPQEEEE